MSGNSIRGMENQPMDSRLENALISLAQTVNENWREISNALAHMASAPHYDTGATETMTEIRVALNEWATASEEVCTSGKEND